MENEKIGENLTEMELMYLKTLARQYPTIARSEERRVGKECL